MIRAALLLAAVATAACADAPFDPVDAGGFGRGRVVAVGDGFAAGASDDALYRAAQERSVLALLAERALGRTDVELPLVEEPGIGIADPTRGRLDLVRARPLTIVRLPRGVPLALGLDRPYDDLGVPGALVTEAETATSTATSRFGNPFFDLVLRGRGTMVEQAAELDPRAILLWIGTSDVLAWVAAGGDADLAPGLPTPPAAFAAAYGRVLDGLLAATPRVVLLNVPDVTEMPIATAARNFVLDPATGDTLLVSTEVIDPVTGDTTRVDLPLRLLGPDGPLAPTDRVVLSALPLVEAGVGTPIAFGGTGQPLPDSAVLDAAELLLAREAVAGYNQTIAALAAQHDLALVDVRALVEELAAGGVVSDGVLLSAAWPEGQAFSLDGAHFTPKGYGVVTNRLIDALNARYGGEIPHIRTADLPGISLVPD